MNLQFFMILLYILMAVVIMIVLIWFIIWFMKERGYFNDNKKKKQESSARKEEIWIEIPDNSEKIKTHRKKGLKCVIILLYWIVMSIPIIFILQIYFPIYIKLIIYFSVLIPIFSISMIWIFHILEEQALKTQPLSQSRKLALIIIAIIIFIILTLGYFDVIQIF